MFPIEKLRRMVNWYNYQNETFNMSFQSIAELEKLYDYAMSRQDLPEFADSWTDTQLNAAGF